MVSPPLNFTNNQTITIEFHTYIWGFESGDSFVLEIFDGTSFNIINSYEGGVDFGNWEFFTDTVMLDANNYTFATDTKIRFRNTANERTDQLYFDQIIIRGDDHQAPTAPINLTADSITHNSVNLSWDAAEDNVQVVEYQIYQDGNLIASTENTEYQVTNLEATTTYSYIITALDASGNTSIDSEVLNITTLEGSSIIAGYYFETGLEGWTDGGLDCNRANTSNKSYEGEYSIRLRGGSDSANMISPVLDLSGQSTVSIEFHTFIWGFETGDSFVVELFNGTTYDVIGTYVGGTDFGNWEFFTDTIILDTNTYALNNDNRIRFRGTANERTDQLYFDQIVISSIPANRNGDENILATSSKTITPTTFEVYPIPATSILNISLLKKEPAATFKITNVIGQTVLSGNLGATIIPIETLNSGTYLVHIFNGDTVFTKRFIKE